jgi:tartrate dehydrogenase/decarboxylase/D-malate dehydrogenase
MLDHLGQDQAAKMVMTAIEQVCAKGILTPDVGGKATTRDVTDAVIGAINGFNDGA